MDVLCLVPHSSLTLCNPMACTLPGPSVHGGSPGKNTGVGCHALLQGIFPTQGWNPGLPHCRQILYRLSHQGSPNWCIGSVQFSHSVVSNSLWPHGRQHARPPCPSPTRGVYSKLMSIESVLEWVASSFSRGSYRPRDQAHISYISCIGRQTLYH